MRLRSFISALLLLFCFSSKAESRYKVLSDITQIEVLEDPAGKFSFEQAVASGNFKPYGEKNLNLEGSISTFWVKFSLPAERTDSLWLEAAQPLLASADLYCVGNDGQTHVYRSGYNVPINKKIIRHHCQVFPLPRDCSEYYFRFEGNCTPVPMHVWQRDVFEQKMSNQKIIYGIYMGIMLFVIFINLFLALSLKKVAYVHYSVLVFFYAIFAATIDGYILYILPNIDILYWYKLNPILNQPNGLLYAILFLQVGKYSPRLHRIAIGVLIYFTTYIIWHNFLSLPQVFALSQLHALVGVLLMATLGIVVGRRGNRLGYYFATAYFIFLAICTVEVLYFRTGTPPYFFEVTHVSIGIFFEVFMLAFLLSKRFEWENEAHQQAAIEAQRQLFEKTQENERIVREQNVILEQKITQRTHELSTEKKKSDDLLLNILPADVADELKTTGSAKAKSYESVSVLFTDIKDFTRISQNQSPEKMIAELDYCFRAFDGIIQKNNLEKIKTIGDAYMCAGGLPIKNQTHAVDIIKAAIEIVRFMDELKKKKQANNEPFFEIRVGISSGPVVAGIVGNSKFAYDIWGDTVNTAARMEQNSEPGKINVSQATYEMVKDKFTCTYRGEIEVKNKGTLKMYFVESAS